MLWPKKGNVAFGAGDSVVSGDPTVAWVDWMIESPDVNLHAAAYREAANLIVLALAEGQHSWGYDKFFFPVAYLYRHAIELSLKECISYAVQLQLIQNDEELRKVIDGHNLYKLWNKLKPGIEYFWSGSDREPVIAAETVISEFHQLDKSGQEFRYPLTKEGKRSLSSSSAKLHSVDLEQLRDVAGGVCTFLDGCTAGFSNTLDSLPSDYY